MQESVIVKHNRSAQNKQHAREPNLFTKMSDQGVLRFLLVVQITQIKPIAFFANYVGNYYSFMMLS